MKAQQAEESPVEAGHRIASTPPGKQRKDSPIAGISNQNQCSRRSPNTGTFGVVLAVPSCHAWVLVLLPCTLTLP